MNIVTGAMQFEKGIKPSATATVYIRLLDTTMMDAAAELVDEQVLDNIDWSCIPADSVQFRVGTPRVFPNHRYEISVLVDCDGDGQISPGDFYTTQAYPVLTRGHPNHINVNLYQIR